MFKITRGKGFQITFENGWTASVQFGEGNYCRNDALRFETRDVICPDAEIAAWKEGSDRSDAKNWHKFKFDNVDGWQTPEQVVKFLAMVAAKKEKPEPEHAVRMCSFPDCKRAAYKNRTTCARHYTAGMNAKQKARARAQKIAAQDEIVREMFANGGPMRPTAIKKRESVRARSVRNVLQEEHDRLVRTWEKG
jgi:hypothetical protein